MKTEIVKVQLPLAGDGTDSNVALIYNKARAAYTHQPIPNTVIGELSASRKGFFHAIWTHDDGWVIAEKVQDQEW